MVSFKEIRELLLLSPENKTINEEEFLLLSEEFKSKNLDFSFENHGGFQLDDVDESECLAEFRFQKHHIRPLAVVLHIPDQFSCYQRSVSSGIEGLCILLKQLSYPCRYSNLFVHFGRPVPLFSMGSNQVLDYVYDPHSNRLSRDSVQAPCMKSTQILRTYLSPVGNLIAWECNCYSLSCNCEKTVNCNLFTHGSLRSS